MTADLCGGPGYRDRGPGLQHIDVPRGCVELA